MWQIYYSFFIENINYTLHTYSNKDFTLKVLKVFIVRGIFI